MKTLRSKIIYYLIVRPQLWAYIKKMRDGKELTSKEMAEVNILALYERQMNLAKKDSKK